jgi:hypothetical protein
VTNAPPDATCLQIAVAGTHNVQRSFSLMPGESTVFLMTGLPTGPDVFSAQAFSESCGSVLQTSVATWLSDPTPATLVPGVVAQVTVVLHRNGEALVTADFQGDDASSPGDAAAAADTGVTSEGGSSSGAMCTYFFDDTTLPLLGQGGTLPPLP